MGPAPRRTLNRTARPTHIPPFSRDEPIMSSGRLVAADAVASAWRPRTRTTGCKSHISIMCLCELSVEYRNWRCQCGPTGCDKTNKKIKNTTVRAKDIIVVVVIIDIMSIGIIFSPRDLARPSSILSFCKKSISSRFLFTNIFDLSAGNKGAPTHGFPPGLGSHLSGCIPATPATHLLFTALFAAV